MAHLQCKHHTKQPRSLAEYVEQTNVNMQRTTWHLVVLGCAVDIASFSSMGPDDLTGTVDVQNSTRFGCNGPIRQVAAYPHHYNHQYVPTVSPRCRVLMCLYTSRVLIRLNARVRTVRQSPLGCVTTRMPRCDNCTVYLENTQVQIRRLT